MGNLCRAPLLASSSKQINDAVSEFRHHHHDRLPTLLMIGVPGAVAHISPAPPGAQIGWKARIQSTANQVAETQIPNNIADSARSVLTRRSVRTANSYVNSKLWMTADRKCGFSGSRSARARQNVIASTSCARAFCNGSKSIGAGVMVSY